MGSYAERHVHPTPLMERQLHRVDDLLDPRAVFEVALIALAAGLDFVDEVFDQIGVEKRPPRFPRVTTVRIEAGWNFDLVEFHGVRSRHTNGFGYAVLFDQATDDRATVTVDAGFDPWIIADGDET